MTGREIVLDRFRRALADVPDAELPPDVAVPRRYRAGHAGTADLVELFAERAGDYGATVVRVRTDGVSAAITAALGTGLVAVPEEFPEELLERDRTWSALREPVRRADLEAADTVLTLARTAVAVTGTIVLDAGPGQGSRALTLIPDRHVCVLFARQIVGDVPEALAGLTPTAPLTFVSGPSATSDIELDRVEGVHGPRHLHLIIVDHEDPA
ncbi:LutC/YkgG family protein [Micromonospora sp. LZ34]